MKTYLVANYPPDRQQSMLRFAALLLRELPLAGVDACLIRPEAHVNIRQRASGPEKYLGYVDKMVLFPRQLRRQIGAASRGTLVHICDHSNAFYTHQLRGIPHLVTCHDLLAVRSARGEFETGEYGGGHLTRWSGRRLQCMILDGLNAAQHVVCVSEATRRDVLRLTTLRPEQVEVIYNGLNYPFAPLSDEAAKRILSRVRVVKPYILHVGGDHWYKNRQGVLEIHAALRKLIPNAPGLVFAGAPLSAQQRTFANDCLSGEVYEIADFSSEELCALYGAAELLLFPSWAEGFGWPIVEAQACGCPVVTTDREPMTEIGGTAAVCIHPEDVDSAAKSVAALLAESAAARAKRKAASIENASRFSTQRMIDSYVRVYRELAEDDRTIAHARPALA